MVSSKLSLSSGPSGAAVTVPWTFRRADLEPFGHVNNAAHWAVLEEVLQSDRASRRTVVEIEYVAPVSADVPMLPVTARNGQIDDLGNATRRMWARSTNGWSLRCAGRDPAPSGPARGWTLSWDAPKAHRSPRSTGDRCALTT